MIHSRLLRYLDEVARCGSIRKAAVTLNVAASAINRQIIALEQQLGTPLFERLPGQMRPTAAGEVLITHARETLKHHRKAIERIETLKDGRFASASIATVGGLSNDMLSYALAEYRRERPFTRFSVSVLAADDIARAGRRRRDRSGFRLRSSRNAQSDGGRLDAEALAAPSSCPTMRLPRKPCCVSATSGGFR